jgi:hypothetical protein
MIIMSCPGPHKPAGEGGMDMTTEAFKKMLDIRVKSRRLLFLSELQFLNHPQHF